MFTKFELDTITIMVLNRNSTKWISKESLYHEVSKQYENNMGELFYEHFLFIWFKLLTNDNFIIVREHKSGKKIKIKTETNDQFFDQAKEEPVKEKQKPSLINQLNHMIKYPQLYKGSILIKDFLFEYYKDEHITLDIFFKFLELYKDTIFLNEKIDVMPSKTNSLNNTINIVVSTFIMSLITMGYYYLT